MNSSPIIGHLDADCFYVSCERIRQPRLRGKAVGVLGNQGACVIAKSYEMKGRGVTTGMPVWEARGHCPEGIFVKRDFRWYEVISRKMLEATRLVSPAVEYYSVDELFFDASWLQHTFGGALPEATRALQQRLLDDVGVPVSIGVSRSKSLAKLASDTSKPFGCRILLEDDEIRALLRGLPVEKITGIARRRRRTLARHGIDTGEQFALADRRLIRRLLTKHGEDLWWELRGEAVRPILTTRPLHRCMSRGGSLGRATADRDRLVGWAVRNVERLIDALDAYQMFCARVGLSLNYKQGGGAHGRTSLCGATAAIEVLAPAILSLLDRIRRPDRRVSYMYVMAFDLQRRKMFQPSLFDPPRPPPPAPRRDQAPRQRQDRPLHPPQRRDAAAGRSLRRQGLRL